MKLSARQIAGVATVAGFTGANLRIAVAVCLAESGGQTTARHVNSDSHHSVDYGLWQINGYWHPELLARGTWSNPADNAGMAKAVFDSAGWRAWSTYKNGAYLAHMAQAGVAVKSPVYMSGVGSHPGLLGGTNIPPASGGSTGTAPNAQQFGGQVQNVSLDGTVSSLTDQSTWLRIAEFLAGLVCILIAMAALTKISPAKLSPIGHLK